MTNAAIAIPAAEPLPDAERVRRALLATRDAVAAHCPGRGELADAIAHGLAGGQHVLTQGPPGTAKSYALLRFLAGIQGCAYFTYQLTSQSDVQDLVGPLSIAALRDRDAREHNTSGYLPTAVIAYLDEVGKGVGGTRNTMLSLLNERTWNGSTVPLWTVVGATNELPRDTDGSDAGAFLDRWLYFLPVNYVESDDDFFRMMRQTADRVSYTPPAALTHDDLKIAKSAIESVAIPDDLIRQIGSLRASLAQAGTVASDRRWVQSQLALRTAAWFAGDSVVDTEHFAVLRWVIGSTDEDRARVEGLLKSFANGLYIRCSEILDDALRAFADRAAHKGDAKAGQALWSRCKEAGREVQRLLGDPRKPETRSRSQSRAADKIRPRMRELLDAVATIEREAAGSFAQPDLSGWK